MKGQAQAQVFVYVLAVVIAGAILLYGYNAIGSFSSQVDEVGILTLKSDLTSAVKVISTDYESTKIYNSAHPLSVPPEFDFVCFTQSGATIDANNYPLIHDSVISNARSNVFLVKNIMERSFYVGNIVVDDSSGFFCTPVLNGNIHLKLEGLGDKARIINIR